MHCDACAGTVADALESIENVRGADVSYDDGTATVRTTRDVTLDELNGALSGTDYALAERGGSSAGSKSATKPHASSGGQAQRESILVRLKPLFLLVGYLVLVPGLVALIGGQWDIYAHMRHFMGGFFLAFSFFKLLDLRGFVGAYRGYDLVAGAVPGYALAYPFIELAIGVLYLASVLPVVLNGVVLVLMLVGIAGVVRALLTPGHVRCACMGTVLDLPMTWVTFTENAVMAVMAGTMLYRAVAG